MDSLAAAAAVMVMSADPESEDAMDLENVAGMENGRGAPTPASESSAGTIDNNSDPPIGLPAKFSNGSMIK